MSKRNKFYEGSEKILYTSPNADTLIQYFKDSVDEVQIDGKGIINNRISELLFNRLKTLGIPNHFIKNVSIREQQIKMAYILPFFVVVRNYAAGRITKNLAIKEGSLLPNRIVEFYFRDKELNNPLISEEHVSAFGWAREEEIETIVEMSTRINDFLNGLFSAISLNLVDIRLEFGHTFDPLSGDLEHLILCDEISPDTCRLQDSRTGEYFGREAVLRGNRDVRAYQEVAHRLGIITEISGGSKLNGEGAKLINITQKVSDIKNYKRKN